MRKANDRVAFYEAVASSRAVSETLYKKILAASQSNPQNFWAFEINGTCPTYECLSPEDMKFVTYVYCLYVIIVRETRYSVPNAGVVFNAVQDHALDVEYDVHDDDVMQQICYSFQIRCD